MEKDENFSDAIEAYEEALKHDKSIIKIYRKIANLYFKNKNPDYDNAFKYYKKLDDYTMCL